MKAEKTHVEQELDTLFASSVTQVKAAGLALLRLAEVAPSIAAVVREQLAQEVVKLPDTISYQTDPDEMTATRWADFAAGLGEPTEHPRRCWNKIERIGQHELELAVQRLDPRDKALLKMVDDFEQVDGDCEFINAWRKIVAEQLIGEYSDDPSLVALATAYHKAFDEE